MTKRFYLVAGLILALGVGIAVARGNGDDQQDKQKAKEKAEEKDRHLYTAAEPSLMSLRLPFSEGGYLGVFLEEVTADRAKELGLGEERGAIVMKVVEGGPAEKAGLKENDVIIAFNGRRVDSVRELQRLLSETPAGRSASLEVIRAGAHQTFTATLSKRSNELVWRPEMDEKVRKSTEEAMKRAQEQLHTSEEALKLYRGAQERIEKGLGAMPKDFGNYFFVGPGEYGFFTGGRLGISVESLTDQLATYFGVNGGKGVLVTQVDENRPGAKAGLKAGDVITAVDNEALDGVNALVRAVNKKAEGQVVLTIVRDKHQETVTVMLEKREPLLRPVAPRRRAA